MEKKQIQLFAVIAIFAVLGIVVVYQVINMQGAPGAKEAVEKTPRNYKEQLMKAEMLVKRLPQHKKALEEKQAILDEYMYEIPHESDPAWLSRQINAIAGEVGVGEVSQKFRPGLSSGKEISADLLKKYGQKAWELHLKTGYHDLGKFLNRLEETNSFLEVNDITIEGKTSEGHEVSLLIRYLTRKGGAGPGR